MAARAPLSHMQTQAAEQQQQQQQWHVSIGLADFVAHVSKMQHIVDMCNTAKLGLIDRAKLKNFMRWGRFIEEVCGLREELYFFCVVTSWP